MRTGPRPIEDDNFVTPALSLRHPATVESGPKIAPVRPSRALLKNQKSNSTNVPLLRVMPTIKRRRPPDITLLPPSDVAPTTNKKTKLSVGGATESVLSPASTIASPGSLKQTKSVIPPSLSICPTPPPASTSPASSDSFDTSGSDSDSSIVSSDPTDLDPTNVENNFGGLSNRKKVDHVTSRDFSNGENASLFPSNGGKQATRNATSHTQYYAKSLTSDMSSPIVSSSFAMHNTVKPYSGMRSPPLHMSFSWPPDEIESSRPLESRNDVVTSQLKFSSNSCGKFDRSRKFFLKTSEQPRAEKNRTDLPLNSSKKLHRNDSNFVYDVLKPLNKINSTFKSSNSQIIKRSSSSTLNRNPPVASSKKRGPLRSPEKNKKNKQKATDSPQPTAPSVCSPPPATRLVPSPVNITSSKDESTECSASVIKTKDEFVDCNHQQAVPKPPSPLNFHGKPIPFIAEAVKEEPGDNRPNFCLKPNVSRLNSKSDPLAPPCVLEQPMGSEVKVESVADPPFNVAELLPTEQTDKTSCLFASSKSLNNLATPLQKKRLTTTSVSCALDGKSVKGKQKTWSKSVCSRLKQSTASVKSQDGALNHKKVSCTAQSKNKKQTSKVPRKKEVKTVKSRSVKKQPKPLKQPPDSNLASNQIKNVKALSLKCRKVFEEVFSPQFLSANSDLRLVVEQMEKCQGWVDAYSLLKKQPHFEYLRKSMFASFRSIGSRYDFISNSLQSSSVVRLIKVGCDFYLINYVTT